MCETDSMEEIHVETSNTPTTNPMEQTLQSIPDHTESNFEGKTFFRVLIMLINWERVGLNR